MLPEGSSPRGRQSMSRLGSGLEVTACQRASRQSASVPVTMQSRRLLDIGSWYSSRMPWSELRVVDDLRHRARVLDPPGDAVVHAVADEVGREAGVEVHGLGGV
jgi:hypothetical protein